MARLLQLSLLATLLSRLLGLLTWLPEATAT